jgi:hypothetical protein
LQEFAKLYWAEDLGQVLITLDGHCVNLRFALPGAVSSALRYDFDETLDGEIRAQDLFSNFNQERTLADVREFVITTGLRALLSKKREPTDA